MLMICHMGQGPLGPGPLGPGPFLVGRTPHQKTHLKNLQVVYVLGDFNNIKRCATSVRSFWRRYRAEISAMCQKTKVSVLSTRRPTGEPAHFLIGSWTIIKQIPPIIMLVMVLGYSTSNIKRKTHETG